ncbi:aminoglycoside phosphotransferase family protein [Brachybacterium sp. FME24]|uniref:aminoglycoside phosphotransferase family protein n=1 Tax=Brachybacterium sp. FME24 TaxID=2742605 RepID=UPI0018684425|nr:aminoglycoside phosphotransferase family protein [Brachybacterium sp. FME24]
MSGGDAGDPGGPSTAGILVAGHPLPPRLADGGEQGLADWRAGLPVLVEEVLETWSLVASAPYLPGGSSAWVAPVRDRDGTALVLKVAWAHEESRDEAAGMAAWQGRGAAEVRRSEIRGQTSLVLMEQVLPGTPLAELLSWPERDEVVAGLLRRMWFPPGDVFSPAEAARFRPLSHMCAWWADEAQARADAGDTGDSPLPRDLVEHGLTLFRELPRQWDGEAVLLATDFHPSNVLARGEGAEREWVLIDPKPYVGDPHYDLLQHMLNDSDRLVAEPGAFADRMAQLTGLDPARARRWLFARCVQEAGTMDGAARAALRLAADGVE